MKRLEHQLEDARIVGANWEKRVGLFWRWNVCSDADGVVLGQHTAGGGDGAG